MLSKHFEPILFYDFLLLDNYSKSAEVNLVCEGQYHENTMTYTKKCMRTFNAKLDNKLRSFRAMKVNWFCQETGNLSFSSCKILRKSSTNKMYWNSMANNWNEDPCRWIQTWFIFVWLFYFISANLLFCISKMIFLG